MRRNVTRNATGMARIKWGNRRIFSMIGTCVIVRSRIVSTVHAAFFVRDAGAREGARAREDVGGGGQR